MTDIPDSNPLDKFFRDSIESSEAKPSEQFWTKAYEGILLRERSKDRKRLIAWRSAAILLGLLMLGLISYNLYISGKVNTLGNQVSQMQNNLTGAANQPAVLNQQLTAANTPTHATATDAIATNASRSEKGTLSSPIRKDARTKPAVRANSNPVQIAMTSHFTPGSHRQANYATGNASQALTANSSATVQSAAASSTTGKIATANLVPLKDKDNPATTSLLPFGNLTYPTVDKYSEGLMPDSAYLNEPNPAEKAKSYFVDKMLPNISVSIFYSSNNNSFTSMNGYNPQENMTASQLSANERQLTGFSTGFNIGYDLSQRFTIQAGCNYQQYQFSIAQTVLNPQGSEPSVFYQLETSSGMINLPNPATNPKPVGATTLIAQGNAIRSYISVPVQLKWNFLVDKKIKFYLTAGSAGNVLAVNNAAIGSENIYGSENAKVNGIEGTNLFTLSYLGGLGAEWKLTKGFSVYFEGTYIGGLMPVSNDPYIHVKSNFTSLAAGVKYHL